MTTLIPLGIWQDFSWSVSQGREITQQSISDWSNGRVILLDQRLELTIADTVQGRGKHYCSNCGSIFESMLLPEIIKDCPICTDAPPVKSVLKYWSHWNFWRFIDSPECAAAPGKVYLFSIPDQPDALKFGFSYSPLKRASGSCLYGTLLWESPMTTRAIARTVELDLHQSVKSGLFKDPALTVDQQQEAGSTETFLLRSGWSLDTIVCHLEATFNQVQAIGWKDYWSKYLAGVDGAPSDNAVVF